MNERSVGAPRLLGTGSAITTLAAAAVLAGGAAARGLATATTFPALLTAVAGLALVGAAGWAWCGAAATLVQAWRGRPRPVRGVPRWLARVVLATCGLAAIGAAAPASAGTDPGPGLWLSGLPFPDRAVGPAHASRQPDEPPVRRRRIVVRPGDSLWSLAAATLPRSATAADVGLAVTGLYRLNRDVIGPDPDLIQPGQHLRTPRPDRREEAP